MQRWFSDCIRSVTLEGTLYDLKAISTEQLKFELFQEHELVMVFNNEIKGTKNTW